MPKIAQYDAPEGLGLRPTETGISAVAGAARRVQGDYSEAAASQEATGHRLGSAISSAGDVAVKYIEHQEISHGATGLAGMIQAKSKQWDDTVKNADPNDPTVARKFLEQSLEPDLEQFKTKGFLTEGGQKWAESHVDQFRQHMFHKTSADMSTLAGEAAVVNTRQTINSLSNTVRGDPSSMGFALKNLESSLGAMVDSSPNLTGTAAGKVRTEVMQKGKEAIIKSAAMGQIEKTGEVPDWVTDPKFSPYIDGTELKQFAQAAKFYQRQNDTADKAARALAEHDARLKFNSAINKLELSTLDPETGLPVVGPQHIKELNKIVQDNDLGASLEPGRVRTMQEGFRAAIARMNKAPAPAGPSREIRNDFLMRIDAGEIRDGAEIYAASEKMTDPDFKYTMSAFRRAQSEEGRLTNRSIERFLKSVGPSIDKSNPLMGRTDQDGKINLDRLRWDLTNKWNEYERTGKDPRDLVNPEKPDYMGNSKALEPYQKPLSESIKDQARRLGVRPKAEEPGSKNLTGPGKDVISVVPVEEKPPPSKPLRKPGETPDQYFKRTGIDLSL